MRRGVNLMQRAQNVCFLGIVKAPRHVSSCVHQSKKIIKCKDVEFMEDSTSVGNDLEMHPSGRNETPNVVVVDTSSKSPCVDDDEGTSDVKEYPSNQEAPPILGCSSTPSTPSKDASTNGEQEGQPLEECRYPLREQRPLREWWKNHILPQQDVERANVACLDDPLNLCDAMHSKDASKWEAAMQEEYGSLMANGTWELVRLPKDRKSVGCKWVFHTKRDASGHIVRHKARLVAKGYSQVQGVDFNETFAPVVKFTTIRCMLAIGSAMDFEIHQMDVKTAFLNGELEEDIYMDQPQGFVQDGKEHLVCKLKRSLYGLKQSPRAWYQRIDMFFTHEGFSRSQPDHSLYVKQTGEYLLIVIIYVDDLIILASNVSILKWLKSRLEDEFEMSDLGGLHYCLGVEFARVQTAP